MTENEQYQYYQKSIFMLLVLGCILGLLLFLVPFILIGAINDTVSGHSILFQNNWLGSLAGVGVVLLFIEEVGVMIYDWRGAITLRGAIKGKTIRIPYKGKQVGTVPTLVLLYLFLPEIMLPVYLVRVAMDRHRATQLKHVEVRQRIAVMEAQLGILPPTEGVCRSCQKPLQVGAEFCSYCGVAVIERPKICPACATTTFPDAKWCPKCGTTLP